MRRNRLINKVIRRRFAVTLAGNEGTYSGVLTDHDDTMFVFEQCQTIPTHEGETVSPIAGRVFQPREGIAYLQELQ